jgi:hypothetical protein
LNVSAELTELEDRALAMCEDEYVDFGLGTDILVSWFDRPIPAAELHRVFEHLAELGLVECQIGTSWAFTNVVPPLTTIGRAKFRATSKGEAFLNGAGKQAT